MKCYLKEPQDTPDATLCDEQGKASLHQGELLQLAIFVFTTALTTDVLNARNLMPEIPPARVPEDEESRLLQLKTEV